MSTFALALILVAALCHAVWNLAAKRVRTDGYAFVWSYDLGSVLLWAPLAIISLVQSGIGFSPALLLAPLVSGVLHIAYQLTLQTGYARADLGVVYPVARGVGPVLSMVVAILVLGERPGWAAALGALVVVGGIVVVATGRSAAGRHGLRAGVAWGAATGLAIAAYTLWDSYSVATLELPPVLYFVTSCLWQVVLMTPTLLRRHRASLPPVLHLHWREIVLVAVLSPLAYILVLEAMRTAPVSLVAPARESSIVVGSLLAWWLFKEPDPLRRMLGAAIVLAGIVLIAV
ncbi:DMT family transporter [Brachybacterium alimentarium]|uniref:EamA family transporter n=1 Tax=Brachybacterium alimentarium TaxID=47845 RepID=A0A2A3YJE0_9MICO|nr:DMT family transporter [Brachybacterium alimentarium]PCC39349.1 EamA family transporter [Brachybacterium alimentarium]RCS75145.1 EamA family transporter [Brachybacterium alimentarium]RCS79308.1 EamA family transporter [Brachybacterium alimentarium]